MRGHRPAPGLGCDRQVVCEHQHYGTEKNPGTPIEQGEGQRDRPGKEAEGGNLKREDRAHAEPKGREERAGSDRREPFGGGFWYG